jgi:hypothetical protein
VLYNQIREQEPRAAEMLSLIAMLDQQIPELLLRECNESDIELFTAIGSLNRLSSITKEIDKETFTIHRWVQLSVHFWLEQHNRRHISKRKHCRGWRTDFQMVNIKIEKHVNCFTHMLKLC